MTTNSRSEPQKPISTTTNQGNGTPNPNYHPASVPLPVYKQLANELQITQTKLQALQSENQQLSQQNQQLRQEIATIVNSAQHLQQVVASFDFGTKAQVKATKSQPQESITPTSELLPNTTPLVIPSQVPEIPEQISEQPLIPLQEVPQRHSRQQMEHSGQINGWILASAVILIILTAFGMGFLVVRPIINQNNNTNTNN